MEEIALAEYLFLQWLLPRRWNKNGGKAGFRHSESSRVEFRTLHRQGLNLIPAKCSAPTSERKKSPATNRGFLFDQSFDLCCQWISSWMSAQQLGRFLWLLD
jgi:hypothetical protein